MPSGSSDSSSCTAVRRPAFWISDSAEPWDKPVTSGTLTCSGPLLTSSRTRWPLRASAPSRGTVRMAKPSLTSSENSRSTVTFSPARSSWEIACGSRRLATGGTGTIGGPSETSSVTVEPTSASSPALGSWSSTWSTGCWLWKRVSRTSKPARSSLARACTSCWPVTRGTSFFSVVRAPLAISHASTPTSARTRIPIVNQGQRLRFSPGSVTGASTGGEPSPSPAGNGIGANAAVPSPPLSPASIWARAASRPCAKSSADCQRCAGSLASAAITTASRAGCTSGRSCDSGVGCSERCLSAIATALSPSKGSRPASISYSITPIE